MIVALKIAAVLAVVSLFVIAEYCKLKDAMGHPCKTQDRVTTVAKTDCPLVIERHPPNIVRPRTQMRS